MLAVKVIGVEPGKTDNWLVFEAFIPSLDINKHFKFEYDGPEINPLNVSSLSKEQLEALRHKIGGRFGFPGENSIEKNREIIGEGLLIEV